MDGNIVTIENEQGVKQQYEVYFTFVVDEQEYIALSDLKTQEILLLECVHEQGGNISLAMIDEDVFDKVKNEFMEIMED
mgnify:CR=1 FL=1